jgi:hypothetical protein
MSSQQDQSRPPPRLQHRPISLAAASDFVARYHRHHKPVRGHKFSIAAALDGHVVGVAIVGRPVSRIRDDGLPLGLSRLCTDGARNACIFLIGKAAKAAFALGFQRIGTYILQSENGVSLRAAGWTLIGETKGGRWNCPSRPRIDNHPTERKTLWEMCV